MWLLTLTAYLSQLKHMPIHSTLQGLELHQPFHYIQEADPGAVGAGLFWLKVSTQTVSRRNDANSAWVSIGAPGTVTSVGLTMPGSGLIFNVTNSPITSTGDIDVEFVNQSPGTFLAGPSAGGPDVPTMRFIANSDLPVMVGDSGAGGTKGAVPAPGIGDAAANFFLKADGTFAVAHPLTTKGDLFGFSTLGTRFPVGANGKMIVADSTQALGVKYEYYIPKQVTQAYAANVAIDASAGDIFDITLTGNLTLDAPTNPVDGKRIQIRLKQDGTGSRTVTLNAIFRIPASTTPPLLYSTGANLMDIFVAQYNLGATKWDIISFIPGY